MRVSSNSPAYGLLGWESCLLATLIVAPAQTAGAQAAVATAILKRLLRPSRKPIRRASTVLRPMVRAWGALTEVSGSFVRLWHFACCVMARPGTPRAGVANVRCPLWAQHNFASGVPLLQDAIGLPDLLKREHLGDRNV